MKTINSPEIIYANDVISWRTWPFRAFSLLLIAAAAQASGKAEAPPHLLAAEELVQKLDLANTDYRHGSFDVSWTSPVHCYADCSGFLDALLGQSYHFKREEFRRWMGEKRPNAAAYYDAIHASRGFTAVPRIMEVLPGDVLAIYYRHRTDNSGHILIADGPPEHFAAKAPLIAETEQWTLAVIDCSESGHGPRDTRHKKGPDGHDHTGLGRGYLRLYTSKSGEIMGFSWSAQTVSAFKGPEEEPLIIGRFDPHFRPQG